MALKRKLFDLYSRVVNAKALLVEQAGAATSKVRNVWHDSIASGLTPAKLAALLKAAAKGDADDYLTLAEEMEERDLHYAAVLGTRKRAVTRLPIIVNPGSDDAKDQVISDEVLKLTEAPEFRDMLRDLMDGLGKGYSVIEVMWLLTDAKWTPRQYIWRDPHFFKFDKATGRELRLKDDNIKDGVELAPFKYITHLPKLKSGLPVRNGLARLAAWGYIFKNFTLKDWMAFIEVYGMPLRVGRYGPRATDDDKKTLLHAVANIGTDAAAIVPKDMEIQFVEGKVGRGGEVFGGKAEYIDKQMSKGVLGQTMTTDSGSSRAQAEVHDEVKDDIRDDDAQQASDTINKDLIRPFVDLNFGPQENYPRVKLQAEEVEDLTALAENLGRIVPLGVEISETDVRSRFGFRKPEAGEKILFAAGSQSTTDTAAARISAPHAPGCPCCGSSSTALARSEDEQEGDDMDALTDEALGDWEEQLAPVLAPVRQLLDEVADFDELIRRLPEVLPDMNEAELIKALGSATFKARGHGDARDQ